MYFHNFKFAQHSGISHESWYESGSIYNMSKVKLRQFQPDGIRYQKQATNKLNWQHSKNTERFHLQLYSSFSVPFPPDFHVSLYSTGGGGGVWGFSGCEHFRRLKKEKRICHSIQHTKLYYIMSDVCVVCMRHIGFGWWRKHIRR